MSDDEFDTDVTAQVAEQNKQAPPETVFANYAEWVTEFALPHYSRRRAQWDPEWYNYTDVCSIFDALWRAWEHLRLEGGPLGMSVFFRDHFFPLMDRITDENGPFARANEPGKKPGPLPRLESAATKERWTREQWFT